VELGELQGVVEQWLREALGDAALRVESVRPPEHASAELAEIWRAQKYSGTDGRQLEGVLALDAVIRSTARPEPATLPVLLKARTSAGLGRTALPDWFEQAGVVLSRSLPAYASMEEFLDSVDREIAVYRLQSQHPAFLQYMPRRLGDRVASERDEYVLLVERVDRTQLMDSADDVSGWTPDRVEAMIDAMAALHAPWLGRTAGLMAGPWPTQARQARAVLGDRELWQQLIEAGRRNFPRIVDDRVYAMCTDLVERMGDWYPARDALPQTLVHDDLNPRNACFRRDGRPLVYDWELSMVDVPQRDLAEFLTFVLTPGTDGKLECKSVSELVERHRYELSRRTGLALDREAWWEGFRVAVRLEAINRVPLQWLFYSVIELGYVERITRTVHELVRVSD
jgi:hypothetical protein